MKTLPLHWLWNHDRSDDGRTPLLRYGVAGGSMALALGLFLMVHLDGFPLILAAVAFAAWFGGLRPGILATASSLFIIMSAYLFSRSGKLLRPVDVEQMILFTLLSFLIGSLSEALQAAKRRAEAFALDWKKSEERYRRIVETANEGIWMIDADAHTGYVNPRMSEMLGYSVDEMLGRSYFDFTDDTVGDQADEGLEHRKQGIREQLDTRFRRKDGTELRAIVSTSPILDNGGKHLGSLAMIMDITERKHMEIELKKERDFIAAVLETAGSLVVVLDRQGEIVRFNSTCQQTTGYSFEEVKGKCFWDLLAVPGELDDVKSGFAQMVAGQFPSKRENRCLTRNGESRLIAWSNTALVDATGSVEYVIKTGIDITERRQAEEGLLQSEERFALAVRGSSDGLWDWNITADETYLSPRFKELIRFDDEDEAEHVSITFEPRLHLEDRDRVLHALRDHLERQVPYDVEYRLRSKEGDYRWYHSRGQAIWDDSGKATRMAGSFRDITDRKQAEEALRLTQFSVDHSADAVFWLGPQGRILYANESACRSLRYTREELLTMRVHEIDLDCSTESWQQRWETIKQQGSVIIQSLYRTSDGREFPVEITSSYLDFRSQEYICSFVRDITERKRAEEALRRAHDDLERRVRERTAELAHANDVLRAEIAEREQAEEALRASHNLLAAFLEGMTEAMYVKDLQGRYQSINLAGAQFLGRSVDEVIGKSDAELFSSETARETIEHDRRVLDSGHTETYEWEGTAAGVTRMFLDTKGVYRDGRGNIIGLIGISRDISERKRAEEALRRAHDELELRVRERTAELAQANEALKAEIVERRRAEQGLRDSEERYRLLFESNPQPMWVYDSETLAFLAVNEASVRHYGYSRDEFLAMPIADIQAPDDASSLDQRMDESKDVSFHNARGWRHRKKDSTVIDVEITSSALTFSGRPAKVVLASDVTVRKRAEDALRRRNRELVAINTVAAVINSSLRLPGVLATLKGLLAETLGIAAGGIFLYDESDRRLYLQTGWGLPLELLAEIDKFLNIDPNKQEAFWKGRAIFKPDFSAAAPLASVGEEG
ncbi:MAG TPA: PAS domain S-box protein, partial [Isosphaeraceae bacterium]|nr:PAS domain S-box protein [Isosphaeraceae bacterium]